VCLISCARSFLLMALMDFDEAARAVAMVRVWVAFLPFAAFCCWPRKTA
jgi:hypothetical protein